MGLLAALERIVLPSWAAPLSLWCAVDSTAAAYHIKLLPLIIKENTASQAQQVLMDIVHLAMTTNGDVQLTMTSYEDVQVVQPTNGDVVLTTPS